MGMAQHARLTALDKGALLMQLFSKCLYRDEKERFQKL